MLGKGLRLFQYAAALIGLLMLLASLLALCGEAARFWSPALGISRLGQELARGSIGWIVLGLAGLLIWALSWFPANGAARQLTLAGAAERASTSRKAYLYAGQFVTLAAGLVEAGLMVAALLQQLLGSAAASNTPSLASTLARAGGALIAFLFWGHLRWVTVHDGDFGRERGRAANWRRAYFYLVALAGFALVIGGSIGYLRAMVGLAGSALQTVPTVSAAPIPAASAWREPIVWSVTALVVGIPLAILIWNTASRLAAIAPAREYGALSRVALLHAGVMFGTGATLVSAAYLLWQGFLLLTGGAGNARLDWPNLVFALVCLPVGIVSWLAFASGARHTVDLSRGARPGRAGPMAVRRFTFYLLAAAALAAFWIGLTQLWQVILSGVASPTAGRFLAATRTELSPLWDRFSLGAALLLIGAPAWWGYWWPCQLHARQAGVPGSVERNSAVRQVYLYGIIAAGTITLALSLLTAAWSAVRGSAADITIGVLSAGAVALFWLITHSLVLRGDRRQEAIVRVESVAQPAPGQALTGAAGAPETRSYRREELPALATTIALSSSANAPRPVVVIDGGNGGVGASLLAALRRALPETPLWPFGLNSNAHAAMVAALGGGALPAPPADALAQSLARAVAIVGPSDMLLPGGLGGEVSTQLLADLAATPGRLVLLPPRDPRLRWVAAPDWPEERWIENAVIEVANVV